MPRSYLRLDPDFAERKRGYPDGAYRALVDVLCAAEYEPKRGVFRNMAILRAVIGRSAKFLPYLFAHHDLRLLADDRIQVIGWDEWQEGNWQVAERMRRVRERREGPVTPDTVTPTVTDPSGGADEPTVMVSSERLAVSGKRLAVSGRHSATESANGIDMELWTKVQRLGEELMGVPHGLPNPYSGFGAQALGQASDVEWSVFEATYRRVARVYGRPTARQLVFDAETILRPTGLAAEKGKAPTQDEKDRAEGRRELDALTARRRAEGAIP